MRRLTLNELEKFDACVPALDVFKLRFGRGADVTDVVALLKSPEFVEDGRGEEWTAWLLGRDLSLAEALVEAGADINADHAEALQWAKDRWDWSLILFLLEQGISLEEHDTNNSRTFLLKACRSYQVRMVNMVLATTHYTIDQVAETVTYVRDEEIRGILLDYISRHSQITEDSEL